MIPWYVFALVPVVFLSTASILEKRLLQHAHTFEYSAALALINAVVALPLLFFVEWTAVRYSTLLLVVGAGALAAAALFLITKGVRHLDLSSSQPLLSIGPAFTALAAFLILGESLGRLQVFGICLITLGLYVLESRTHEGFFAPFRRFASSKYSLDIVLGIVIFSLTSIIDRHVLGNTGVPVLTYVALIHISIALHFAIVGVLLGNGLEKIGAGFRKAGWPIVPISLLLLGSRLSQAFAVQLFSVGPVIALKRSSVLITTMVGGGLRHEKHLLHHALAAIIIVAGSLLIVMSK